MAHLNQKEKQEGVIIEVIRKKDKKCKVISTIYYTYMQVFAHQ
jgi:hypothetical protein